LNEYPDAPHADSLAVGEAYQEFIRAYVESLGGTLTFTTTKRDQIYIGESLEGWEVKLDEPCLRTGRLAIEVAEKTRRSNRDYVDSGIMRRDNTIWYVQGNYEKAWLFWKADLIDYYCSELPPTHTYGGTRRSFYLILEKATQIARRVAVFADSPIDTPMAEPWSPPATSAAARWAARWDATTMTPDEMFALARDENDEVNCLAGLMRATRRPFSE
jgi:hypothetical protein